MRTFNNKRPLPQRHGGNSAALFYENLKSRWIRENPACSAQEYQAAMARFDQMAFGGDAREAAC